VLITGCSGTSELDLAETSLQVDKPDDPEADIGCGPSCLGNSPIIAALGPFEVSLTGLREPKRGWKLYPQFRKGDELLEDVHVDGASLAGLTRTDPGPLGGPAWRPMSQPDFVGMSFRMNGRTEGDWDFEIDNVLEVTYYPNHPDIGSTISNGSTLPKIWAYHIHYWRTEQRRPEPSDGTNHRIRYWGPEAPRPATPGGPDYLCPNTEKYDEYDEHEDVEANWVVFWKGDRYDPDTGEIYPPHTGDADWFNMSCAGEAGIKMLRTGLGEAVAPNSAPQARQKRQAVLNMFMAKYCPTKWDHFTTLGKPVYWVGTQKRVDPPPTGHELEAIWNDHGAVCLNAHRYKTPSCHIDECDETMAAEWGEYGLLRSRIRPYFDFQVVQ
jgi:hypothetical protein